MKAAHTFLFTTVLTAGLMVSGMLMGDSDDKVLAEPVGLAALGDVELTGRIVDEADGIYAVLTAKRPEDHASPGDLTYSYCVSYMSPSSPMSRMMPMPREIKRGQCTIPAGTGVFEEKILVQQHPELTLSGPELKVVQTADPVHLGGAGSWTLAVSRSDSTPMVFAGAAVPSVTPNRTELGNGAFVLAAVVSAPTGSDKVQQ